MSPRKDAKRDDTAALFRRLERSHRRVCPDLAVRSLIFRQGRKKKALHDGNEKEKKRQGRRGWEKCNESPLAPQFCFRNSEMRCRKSF
jgi:hypothetical protein